MNTFRIYLWALLSGLLLFISLLGCSEDDPTKNAKDDDTSSDNNSDADSDSDADGDTDPDSDITTCIVKPGDEKPEGCIFVKDPACGDGIRNQDWEICDDGNTLPGDGANGRCTVEPNFSCDTDAVPCTCKTTVICGNGVRDPGEVCDDNNTNDGDGCNSTCDSQDEGFVCKEGEACTKTFACGNGRIESGETCEDGNKTNGDGCSSDCKVEGGFECLIPNKPCTPLPRCGDGTTRFDLGEQCDDGNLKSGDGCEADCKAIETGYECPSIGGKCTLIQTECGDGELDWDEECDDGDLENNDGCTSTCIRENGYVCPYQGAPCIPDCGDGVVTASESCDDGDTDDNNGCTTECKWEEGKTCKYIKPLASQTYECIIHNCGDGVLGSAWRSTVACDDKNKEVGDGCSPLCQKEPKCVAGAGCTSECGDGIVIGDEACDDGNNRNLDGCDENCKVEPGYTCDDEEQNGLGSTLDVLVVYKDFEFGDNNYPDFNTSGITGCEDVSTGIVKTALSAEGKPVLGTGSTSSPGCDYVESAASFATWYDHNEGDQDAIVVDKMTLFRNESGNYVNRWLEDGTRWLRNISVDSAVYCAGSTGSCADCEDRIPDWNDTDWKCYDPCTPWGNTQICAQYQGEDSLIRYDGNPVFFPIDGKGIDSKSYTAKVPHPVYGGGWMDEEEYIAANGMKAPAGYDLDHNFYFTSEIRFWFKYDSTTKQVLNFVGDDDVWVFVNGKLALDLGGIHVPLEDEFTIQDLQTSHSLKNGEVYEIVVFQAERQRDGSSYKLTLGGFNARPSVCVPDCGDGKITIGEMCDNGDGKNSNSAYNGCRTDCTLGPRCGDGIVQPQEECDNKINNDLYGLVGENPCGANCKLPAFCGDGVIQPQHGEQCDDGNNNNGAYGTCNADCTLAPFCGDGKITDKELCDIAAEAKDKSGNPIYACLDCTEAPRCGDGSVQTDWGELCDGAPVDGNECTTECRFAGICGDGVVDKNAGEQCDYGISKNDGSYGGCTPGCLYAPRCGDGNVQAADGEECDSGDGLNTGLYGECAANCKMGPHCGDGKVQEPYEACDQGFEENDGYDGDTCSNECVVFFTVE